MREEDIAKQEFPVILTGEEIDQAFKAIGTATDLWAKNRRHCPASINLKVLIKACDKIAHSTDLNTNDLSSGIESHPQRCGNGCPNKACYFHPDMETLKHGLDINYVITIPEFIRRFGCATYQREFSPIEILDVILNDLSHRSDIGCSMERLERMRGKNWLRNELLETIKRNIQERK